MLEDAEAAAARAAALAGEHAETPMMGRTLLQHAEPTTFGRRAAAWGRGIDAARADLKNVPLPVQMGGPVGAREPGVATAVAQDLGLQDAPTWQADRVPVARLGAALGVLAGALGKVGRDVALL